MNASILNKIKQQAASAGDVSLCCVTYIDVENLIYAATSIQALPKSKVTLYFTADIDQLRRVYNPEYRVNAVVTGDYISPKLLTYLKYACNKDALTPYIIYEPTDNPRNWRVIKPVETKASQSCSATILNENLVSDMKMNIETALSIVEALTGMDVGDALTAMQEKASASDLEIIEVATSITTS